MGAGGAGAVDEIVHGGGADEVLLASGAVLRARCSRAGEGEVGLSELVDGVEDRAGEAADLGGEGRAVGVGAEGGGVGGESGGVGREGGEGRQGGGGCGCVGVEGEGGLCDVGVDEGEEGEEVGAESGEGLCGDGVIGGGGVCEGCAGCGGVLCEEGEGGCVCVGHGQLRTLLGGACGGGGRGGWAHVGDISSLALPRPSTSWPMSSLVCVLSCSPIHTAHASPPDPARPAQLNTAPLPSLVLHPSLARPLLLPSHTPHSSLPPPLRPPPCPLPDPRTMHTSSPLARLRLRYRPQ